jgi:hypothetical protein
MGPDAPSPVRRGPWLEDQMPLPVAPPPYGPMPAPAVLSGPWPHVERRTGGFVPGSPLRRWDDRLDLAHGLALDIAAPAASAWPGASVLPATTAVLPSPATTAAPPIAIAAVLLSVGIAQAGDLLTFVRMILSVGIHAELNPLVKGGVGTVGIEGLALMKIALVAFVVATFAFVYRYHPRVAVLVATVGTAAGLIGTISNLIAVG